MNKPTGTSPHTRPAHEDITLEELSSLVDGELEAGRCTGLLQRLCSDEHVRREWMLMHVTGDALRSSEVASLHSESFVARVSSALDDEPAIVAPRARTGSQRFMRRVVLPGAAVAAAASVLVFVAVPQLRDPAGSGTTLAGKAAGTTPVVATAEPAAGSNGQVGNGQVVVRLPELDAYLAAHREQAGTAMTLRSAPYLRTSATVPR